MVFIEVVTAIGGCCSRRQLCGGAFSGGEGIGEDSVGGQRVAGCPGEREVLSAHCPLSLPSLRVIRLQCVCVCVCVCVCMRVCVYSHSSL